MDAEITLTPTTDDDAPALRAQHPTPEVAKWWDLAELAASLSAAARGRRRILESHGALCATPPIPGGCPPRLAKLACALERARAAPVGG